LDHLFAREPIMEPTRKNPDKKPPVGDYRYSRAIPTEQQEQWRLDTIAYFEQRRKRLQVVATTQTRCGQIIDWIRRDSQHPSGTIATPPPMSAAPGSSEDRKIEHVRFELEDDPGSCGPKHTVPVLRKDLSTIQF